MFYKNLYIRNPCKISIRNGQIVVSNDEGRHVVPSDEIGAIVIESRAVTVTASFFSICAEHKIVVIFTDEKHMPTSFTLPVSGHSRSSEVAKAQILSTNRLKSRLWRKIVVSKIVNQSDAAGMFNPKLKKRLAVIARSVKMRDSENAAAEAAAVYFKNLFTVPMIRRSDDDIRSAALDYGYAVVRACVARSIVGHGMIPQIGIFHRSGLNPFNLADDLIEPYRPFVDIVVREMDEEGDFDGEDELTTETKGRLIRVLESPTSISGGTERLQSAIDKSAASLKRCFLDGNADDIELPFVPGHNEIVL
ncbi:type II CRISPR-associated endonuclease Cas1 [Hydrogenimonas sp.]